MQFSAANASLEGQQRSYHSLVRPRPAFEKAKTVAKIEKLPKTLDSLDRVAISLGSLAQLASGCVRATLERGELRLITIGNSSLKRAT